MSSHNISFLIYQGLSAEFISMEFVVHMSSRHCSDDECNCGNDFNESKDEQPAVVATEALRCCLTGRSQCGNEPNNREEDSDEEGKELPCLGGLDRFLV